MCLEDVRALEMEKVERLVREKGDESLGYLRAAITGGIIHSHIIYQFDWIGGDQSQNFLQFASQ